MKIVTLGSEVQPVEVSIVVVFKTFPNLNIRSFLDSTKHLSIPYEVILVTRSLKSDAKQVLTSLFQGKANLMKIRLVLLNKERDKGPASDRNFGAALADASVLLFADDDALFLGDINVLLDYLHTRECYGIQPLILKSMRTQIVDSAGEFVEKGRPLYRPSIRGYGNPLHTLSDGLRIEEVASMRSAFMLVRKDAFYAVGGFDSDFNFNYEDVDLGWRMTCLAFRQFFIPFVKVQHEGSRVSSNRKLSDKDLKLGIVNLYLSHLKIHSYRRWPYFFVSFQQEVLCHAFGRKNNGEIAYPYIFKEFYTLNRMLISRTARAHQQKKLLDRKFTFGGLRKLEDMATGKRFVYGSSDKSV